MPDLFDHMDAPQLDLRAPRQEEPPRGALLILSCSATKRPGEEARPFYELYTGPMWQQLHAAGFPLARVAAVSALYGFMEPDHPPIWTYDAQMDEEHAYRISHQSNHVARLKTCIMAHGSAHIFGGELYQRVARTAERVYPELSGRITYANGTFLQQRKQLGEFLRAQQGV